ncbi:MAG: murein biosynthesis integral membrane protein MurJ [Ramlibacter sp.]
MNLLRTLAAISSMTMLSRVTGLLRDSLFATYFGQSNFTDAFNVAFRLPNLLRRLFAEGAFSQAFVPILAEYKNKHGESSTKTLVDHVGNSLIWATLATSVIGIIGSPVIMWLIAGDLQRDPAAFDSGVLMTRVMFPYIACMAFVSLGSGILNTWREFRVPAFAPVLLNVANIFGAVVLSKYFAIPIMGMAVATMIGGVLQVGVLVPSLVRIGMLPRLSFNPLHGFHDPGVRRILLKMGPAVFAVAAAQISLLINTHWAINLGEGMVSALQNADRLMEFPTALLGVALGTVLLPYLSKANQDGDRTEYTALLDWGLRLTFLLALPAAVGLAVMAEPLISALFNYGKFSAADVARASAPLTAYGAGLIGIILVKTLAPAFYARQDIRTPVKIAVFVLVATQLMNLVFVPLLGVAGLALSIGMGACLNALFLYTGLRRLKIYTPKPGWAGFFVRLLVAVAVMGVVAWFCQSRFDWPAMHAHKLVRVGLLLGIIAIAGATYFGVLIALGFRPRDFKRTAK